MNAKRDLHKVKKTMAKYTGERFAHIGVIAINGGERQVTIGGNVMLLGGCLAEVIFCLAKDSGMGQEMVDEIHKAATYLVSKEENGEMEVKSDD